MLTLTDNKDKDYENLVKLMKFGLGKNLTKLDFFNILSKFTYKHYYGNMGDIIRIFPLPYHSIKNWNKYVYKKESNTGKEIEQVLVEFAKEKNIISENIRGKGTDITIGNKHLEIKSSSNNRINTQLQTSFYKDDPNKFYVFVTNTSQPDLDLRIVSSQLLYNLSLGMEICSEFKHLKNSPTLLKQIGKGLETLDFPHLIQTSINTGESLDSSKSFTVGENVRVRFVIYLEPK